MRGLGILILVVIFFWIVWPWISKWLKRKAMEKAEDYMRVQMGMPPRDKKNRKSQQKSQTQREYYSQTGNSQYTSRGYRKGPIIPKEYAEDVEFTETKDFSSTESINKGKGKVETYHESQVSDAEWTEVKKPRTK